MILEQDLIEQREQIQHDLETRLDGLDADIISDLCKIIIERFAILISKVSEK